MQYLVRLVYHKDRCYVATFKDFDNREVMIYTRTRNTSLPKLKDVLTSLVKEYVKSGKPLPDPHVYGSKINTKLDIVVPLDIAFSMKANLLDSMLAGGINQSELANRLGKPVGNLKRIFNIDHITKVDTLVPCFNAIGVGVKVVYF